MKVNKAQVYVPRGFTFLITEDNINYEKQKFIELEENKSK